jgi:hypothetical protein
MAGMGEQAGTPGAAGGRVFGRMLWDAREGGRGGRNKNATS